MAESFLLEARVGNLIATLQKWDDFGCHPKTIPRLLSFKTLVIITLSVSLITSSLLLYSIGLYYKVMPWNPELRVHNDKAALNSFESHCKSFRSLAYQKTPYCCTISHWFH
jgi:hypothetical protein